MKKVITYGTYDLLHYGHIRLLERAKALGDYLIVGVTAEDFDKKRGKINVHQSLMERVESVKATGLADEIIIEEYVGQKIDDIKRYDIDIFTVGSDWTGKFDYLKEYCDVVYLDRTQGISSTGLRNKNNTKKLGIVGDSELVIKYINESEYVNGLVVTSLCTTNLKFKKIVKNKEITIESDYDKFLDNVDCVCVVSSPQEHYNHIKKALNKGKNVIAESPICLTKKECTELYKLASKNKLILLDAIKTAYSTAFNRLILLVKSGSIGDIVSVDAICTSLREIQENNINNFLKKQNSICAWGPTALLPIFTLLGTKYTKKHISSLLIKDNFDLFTKIDFNYKNAVASIKIGKGAKSESELIITGTKGYMYIPSPWWKTDYFEIRCEDKNSVKKYFYELDGEGIRYELVTFVKSIEDHKNKSYIDEETSKQICQIMDDFNKKRDFDKIMIREDKYKL